MTGLALAVLSIALGFGGCHSAQSLASNVATPVGAIMPMAVSTTIRLQLPRVFNQIDIV